MVASNYRAGSLYGFYTYLCSNIFIIQGMAKVSFQHRNTTFYDDLKVAVDGYFKETKIKSTGNYRLYTKLLVLITATIALYVLLVFFNTGILLGILGSGLLGFTLACIGFNVMHDACHGSYSDKKWINETLGLSLNVMGGNAFIWKQKHNIIHHTYTNIDGIDDDIAKMPFIRQCPTQSRLGMHRYQHFYSIFLYSLSSIMWVFMFDFLKYFKGKVQSTTLPKMDSKEHIIFWVSKLFYLIVYITLPIYMVGWQYWLVGFLTLHAVMGITLAMVFQLAHVVEITHFEEAKNENLKVENEWAIHQVITTANFATENKVVSWFLGGLNFQVEHHLFPKVSHVHYPQISKILKAHCEKYQVRYNNFSTMTDAIVSHFRFMKQLGKA
jgi:linoleoyl-CoA desaturase